MIERVTIYLIRRAVDTCQLFYNQLLVNKYLIINYSNTDRFQ